MLKERIMKLLKPKRIYPPILPGPREWPVVRLSKFRKEFILEVIKESVQNVKSIATSKQKIIEEIETTLYREKMRIKQNPWRVDPEDEHSFWEHVKQQLIVAEQHDDAEQLLENTIKEIITRYANEIAGNFKPTSYRLARAVVTFGFARLLNAAGGSFWSDRLALADKVEVSGEVEQIRKLAQIGTVLMVPTHFSNLDSVLIGWIIQYLGLPPFIYGAGLNLFNIRIFAYFMNSLGAYKVDRRKKNLLYLETLKVYSSLALRYGCHSLFFPGGTRSRSGALEERLKLGLLGTAFEAQRINLKNNSHNGSGKIFVVPVVINYHFVLEAPILITDFLRRTGQGRFYTESDEFSTSYKILKFIIKFFFKGSKVSLSIGKGLDLFGNYVDDNGVSLNKIGHEIDIREYFLSNGKINSDKQRENEYTRRLSNIIVTEFHRINKVFSSHLVAYVAFEMLRHKFEKLDLYNLLRLPEEEHIIPYDQFKYSCEMLRNNIFDLHKKGEIDYAPHLEGDIEKIIKHGMENVGMYHAKRPLLRNKAGNITSEDLSLLYYYHNRLTGYSFENFIR